MLRKKALAYRKIIMEIKNKRQKIIYEHYLKIFHEEPSFSVQLKSEILLKDKLKPITTFIFCPTNELPFWKLCTIGASDYIMPKREIGYGRFANRRNEYVIFVSPNVEISESSTEWLKLNAMLWKIAKYAYEEKRNITVSDTLEIKINGKYYGMILLLPELLNSSSSAKCYTSKNEFVSIFQVMPVTKEAMKEKNRKGQEGTYWLMEQIYTHDDDYKIISSRALATLEDVC